LIEITLENDELKIDGNLAVCCHREYPKVCVNLQTDVR